jgi:hypothetical protein
MAVLAPGTVDLVLGGSCILFAVLGALLVRGVPSDSGLSFRQRLRVYYTSSTWVVVNEWIQAVGSLLSVALYIGESYSSDYPLWAFCMEIFLSVYFLSNWLLELVLSRGKFYFLFSMLSLVDLGTSIPVLVAVMTKDYSTNPAGFMRLYRVLSISRIFRPLRALRAEKLSASEDAVRTQTIRLVGFFTSILLMATGFVQLLAEGDAVAWGADPDGDENMPFHDALYFVVVTFSTVGYGDISPPTNLARMVVVSLIGFFFFVVPRELTRLNQLLDLGSKYRGTMPKRLSGDHIVVACDPGGRSLVEAFLEEFFHEDHGLNAKHLAMLVPGEPDNEWKSLLLNYSNNERVTYIRGDPRNGADLHRVRADSAAAIFILSDRNATDVRDSEKSTFMRAITVQDYSPGVQIFVQALSLRSYQRLATVGIPPRRIVCTSNIKTRMLATGCLWEGAATLISNLLVSASDEGNGQLPAWMRDYVSGMGKEIYPLCVGTNFHGLIYSTVAAELFARHGVLLMGISRGSRVDLHPGAGYVIARDDKGFVIADDIGVTAEIQANAAALVQAIHRQPKDLRGAEGGAARPDQVEEEILLKTPPPSTRAGNGSNGAVHFGSSVMRALSVSAAAISAPHIVVITPTLADICTLIEVLTAPQATQRSVVIMCPMHSWNQEQDDLEVRKMQKLARPGCRWRLVPGKLDDKTMKEANIRGAHTILLKSGNSRKRQTSEEGDAEAINMLVEIIAYTGSGKRVLVELNDMTYGEQYEILMNNMRTAEDGPRNQLIKQAGQKSFADDWGGSGTGGGSKHSLRRTLSPSGLPSPRSLITAAERRRGSRTAGLGHGNTASAATGTAENLVRSRTRPSVPHWSMSEGFASGSVLPNNFAEILLCQSFFNSDIIMVVNALLGGGPEDYIDEGQAYSSMDGDVDEDERAERRFLAQIHPPSKFFRRRTDADTTFTELVRYLLREFDCMPLAVVHARRGRGGRRSSGWQHADATGAQAALQQQSCPTYVSTCPRGDITVQPDDKVFVIVPGMQTWTRIREDISMVVDGGSLPIVAEATHSARGQIPSLPSPTTSPPQTSTRGASLTLGLDVTPLQVSSRAEERDMREGSGATRSSQPGTPRAQGQHGSHKKLGLLIEDVQALTKQVGFITAKMENIEECLLEIMQRTASPGAAGLPPPPPPGSSWSSAVREQGAE